MLSRGSDQVRPWNEENIRTAVPRHATAYVMGLLDGFGQICSLVDLISFALGMKKYFAWPPCYRSALLQQLVV